MKCVVGLVGIMALLAAGPVYAQTAPAGQTAAPSRQAEPAPLTKGNVGLLSGIQVVDRTKAIVGGEFSIRLRKGLQATLDVGRFGDVVTASRVAKAESFASYIQQTQGQTASVAIDAPAWVGTAGLRYIHQNSFGVRPYVLVNAGMARVEFRPSFTVDGKNIGTSVRALGVTMGRDLLGPGNHFAYGGGAGLVFGNRWYLDLGVRLTRISTPGEATNVRRISIGFGRRF